MATRSNVLPARNRFRNRSEETEEEQIERAKRENYEDEIVRQIDTLQQTVMTERDAILGQDWYETIDRLYNLTEGYSPAPSFRPKILVPELQIDLLHEASDLSDLSPIPYIIRKGKDARDEEREKAFIANWKQSDYNLEILRATIWSLFAGTSYLEVSWDANANNGDGKIVVTARDPSTVYRDPFAIKDEDIRFVIFEDMMYIDDVRARWPEQGWRVVHKRAGSTSSIGQSKNLSVPWGPLAMSGGPVGEAAPRPFAPSDSRVRVRKLWINDYSRRRVKKDEPTIGGAPNPEFEPAYPNGRLIIECEGVVLFDGANPVPLKIKPVITVWGMPPLTSVFAPPAMKYTLDLQELAEKMYTQTFENAVRVNNAVIFIDEGSGIDSEEFGGVPGEVHTITSGSKPPEFSWPTPLPQHMMELPKTLLELAKELRGMTPSRKGMTQAGNVSSPLFDAALMQSQSLTRMRSRFLAGSFQRLAQIVFVFMGRFFNKKRTFPVFQDQKYEPVEWQAIDAEDLSDYILQIDENSIRPYSQTALRAMVPIMKQLGIIDPETAMDLLDIPNKEQVIERLKQQAQAAAQMEQAKQAQKAASKVKK